MAAVGIWPAAADAYIAASVCILVMSSPVMWLEHTALSIAPADSAAPWWQVGAALTLLRASEMDRAYLRQMWMLRSAGLCCFASVNSFATRWNDMFLRSPENINGWYDWWYCSWGDAGDMMRMEKRPPIWFGFAKPALRPIHGCFHRETNELLELLVPYFQTKTILTGSNVDGTNTVDTIETMVNMYIYIDRERESPKI